MRPFAGPAANEKESGYVCRVFGASTWRCVALGGARCAWFVVRAASLRSPISHLLPGESESESEADDDDDDDEAGDDEEAGGGGPDVAAIQALVERRAAKADALAAKLADERRALAASLEPPAGAGGLSTAPMSYTVIVHLIAARQLAAQNYDGTSDPFVEVPMRPR